MASWRVAAAAATWLFLVAGCLAAKTRRDTYLEAYMESHGPSGMATGEVYGSPSPGGYPYPAAVDSSAAPEPHSAPDNPLDPVHGKLVLAFKVLLKLLIFKLVVKFIAIICVLFFLPKLSGLGLARAAAVAPAHAPDPLTEMARSVMAAIAAGPPELEDRCRGADAGADATERLVCQLLRALRSVDQKLSVRRIFGVLYKKGDRKKEEKHSKQKQRALS